VGWPVTPVAEKVTGWQTIGFGGETETPPITGAGSSTVSVLLREPLPTELVAVREIVFAPGVPKVTPVGLRTEEPLGLPSGWKLHAQEVGAPEDWSVKVTGVPG